MTILLIICMLIALAALTMSIIVLTSRPKKNKTGVIHMTDQHENRVMERLQ